MTKLATFATTNTSTSYEWERKNLIYDNKAFPNYRNIKGMINGYARIVYYNVHENPTDTDYTPYKDPWKNEIVTIREGYFNQGLQEGYGRMMGNQKEAFVGFFREGKLHGKAIFYKNGIKVTEGIWNPDFQDYYEDFGMLP